MNVLILAVCMNIAIVNARHAVIDIDKILNIIQTQRRNQNSGSRETNEPMETLPIMPGFYMVKPDGITNTLFKYPKGLSNTVYSSKKQKEVSKKKPKEPTSDSISKDMILKIFNDVFNGDPNSRDQYDTTRNKLNITKQFVPINAFKNKDLVANIKNNIKNTHTSEGDYKIATIANQKNIPKEYIPNTEFKNKDVLSRIMMEAVKDVHKSRASQKYDTSKKNNVINENIPNVEPQHKDVLATIMKAVKNIHENQESDKIAAAIYKPEIGKPDSDNLPPTVLINTKPTSTMKSPLTLKIQDILNNIDMEELENDAGEDLDDDDVEDNVEDEETPDYRRRHTVAKDRNSKYSSEGGSRASSSASAIEKNPGNPFTIHKNKYRQNWLWNHYMDGDHMNINPLGPQFASLGPSGPELFFGRKWWYFNQDDYKPMG